MAGALGLGRDKYVLLYCRCIGGTLIRLAGVEKK